MKYALTTLITILISLSAFTQNAAELTEAANQKMKEGNSLGAIKDYTSAIVADAMYADAYYGRGSVYAELDQYENALTDLNKALEIDPGLTEIYYNRAYVYALRGDHDQALIEYTRYIESHPNEAQAWLARAEIKHMKTGLESARSDYSKFLELDWETEERHLIRSEVLLKLGDTTGSVDELNKYIAKAPSDHKLYRMRGRIHFAKGEHNKAIADLSTALLLNEDAESFALRSDVYADIEDWSAALDDMVRCVENGSTDPEHMFLVGYYGLLAEQFAQSVKGFAMAKAKGYPQTAELHYNLGLAQYRLGQKDKACSSWRNAEDLSSELISRYCGSSSAN